METTAAAAFPPLRPFSRILITPFFCILIFFTTPSAAATANETAAELVHKVCNQTRYYTYCVNALYSDPRTPNADAYFLAYISFGIAYVNASNNRDYFSRLRGQSHPDHRPMSPLVAKGVDTCMASYEGAVSALESAYRDLNSESFGRLEQLSRVVGRAAVKCETSFAGKATAPVTVRNRDMKRLSGICIVVSKLFNSS